MKNLYKVGVALLAILSLSVMASAKDVEVKWSGPSGMGQLIYWSPDYGLTNMVISSNGITSVRFGSGAITPTVTKSTSAVSYAKTNAPTITVSPLSTTLNYAGTNAPTVTVTLTPLTLVFTNVTDDQATTNIYTVVTGMTASAVASVTAGSLSVMTNATATATLTEGTIVPITNVTVTIP